MLLINYIYIIIIHTFVHTYVYTNTYTHTYIHTYTHTYIHTYIHPAISSIDHEHSKDRKRNKQRVPSGLLLRSRLLELAIQLATTTKIYGSN